MPETDLQIAADAQMIQLEVDRLDSVREISARICNRYADSGDRVTTLLHFDDHGASTP
jgi:hypothetical protein